jgi:anthranilate 1,2-dioxygenase small subunit
MDTLRLICRAQADYARCIDDGPLEHWPDFFVEDGAYKVTTADDFKRDDQAALVWADSRARLHDCVAALREAKVCEREGYRHLLGLPTIISETQTETATETPFVVVRILRGGPTEVFASGRYLDRYRLMGSLAKLCERIVVCDAPAIGEEPALPL